MHACGSLCSHNGKTPLLCAAEAGHDEISTPVQNSFGWFKKPTRGGEECKCKIMVMAS